MGGEGAMRRWQKIGLGGSDFRHATPRGYEAIGNMFYKALLQAFHAHLTGGNAEASIDGGGESGGAGDGVATPTSADAGEAEDTSAPAGTDAEENGGVSGGDRPEAPRPEGSP